MAETTLSLVETLKSDKVTSRFREVIGKKTPAFIASLITIINQNALLKNADQNSIMLAAMTAATLDLPINANLGFAYIIPYGNKAQFQIGYKGFIQLAIRSGKFKSLDACKVYEGQLKLVDPLRGHTFDWNAKKSDKIIGFVAMFSLLNGFEKQMYMTVDELRSHGVKYSKTYQKGVWQTDFDSMALKTVIKLLLSKYAPLSIEMEKAQIYDHAVINSEDDVDYPDNDSGIVDVDEVNEEKEEARIIAHMNTFTDYELLMNFDVSTRSEAVIEARNNKLKELKVTTK